MPSIKVIKHRISGVTVTKQVMKAMNMVAAAKLQKAKTHLDDARPAYREAIRLMEHLKTSEAALASPFVTPRPVQKTAYIIVTGDRGLCGGYNINIANMAYSHMRQGKNEVIIAIGLKGWEFFRRRRKTIAERYMGASETALFEDAERIATRLSAMYLAGEVDEAYVAYTQFESALSFVPRMEKLLPFGGGSYEFTANGMKFEPDAKTYLDIAAPLCLTAFLYGALAESAACEQAARMMSMDSAANNASDIIDDLTHQYNRKRQAAITRTISEIVSGAN